MSFDSVCGSGIEKLILLNRSLFNTLDEATALTVLDTPEGKTPNASAQYLPDNDMTHTALASCLTTRIVAQATIRGIEIEEMELKGDIDLICLYVMCITINNINIRQLNF